MSQPTPENIIEELRRIQDELNKAPQALFEAETALAEAEDNLDRVESMALLRADGTVPIIQATAKLASADARLARDIKRAELNRIKSKIRILESASVAVSVMGRQVELAYKHS